MVDRGREVQCREVQGREIRRIPLRCSVRTTLRLAVAIEAEREPGEVDVSRVLRCRQDSVRCRRASEIDEAQELHDALTETF